MRTRYREKHYELWVCNVFFYCTFPGNNSQQHTFPEHIKQRTTTHWNTLYFKQRTATHFNTLFLNNTQQHTVTHLGLRLLTYTNNRQTVPCTTIDNYTLFFEQHTTTHGNTHLSFKVLGRRK